MKRVGFLVVMVACSKAEPPEQEPAVSPKRPEVKVELAGVTLGDDCADGVTTQPIAPPSAPAASAPRPEAAGDCGLPGCLTRVNACEQTVMQLALDVPADAAATTFKIKRVELLDDQGTLFSTLTARAPSRWNGRAYVAWDETVATGKTTLAVSYKLSAPDWSKTHGKLGASGKRFTLRVTTAISDRERTIEKQAIVLVMPEPAAVT